MKAKIMSIKRSDLSLVVEVHYVEDGPAEVMIEPKVFIVDALTATPAKTSAEIVAKGQQILQAQTSETASQTFVGTKINVPAL